MAPVGMATPALTVPPASDRGAVVVVAARAGSGLAALASRPSSGTLNPSTLP